MHFACVHCLNEAVMDLDTTAWKCTKCSRGGTLTDLIFALNTDCSRIVRAKLVDPIAERKKIHKLFTDILGAKIDENTHKKIVQLQLIAKNLISFYEKDLK